MHHSLTVIGEMRMNDFERFWVKVSILGGFLKSAESLRKQSRGPVTPFPGGIWGQNFFFFGGGG